MFYKYLSGPFILQYRLSLMFLYFPQSLWFRMLLKFTWGPRALQSTVVRLPRTHSLTTGMVIALWLGPVQMLPSWKNVRWLKTNSTFHCERAALTLIQSLTITVLCTAQPLPGDGVGIELALQDCFSCHLQCLFQ